jgi:hypothetical protein
VGRPAAALLIALALASAPAAAQSTSRPGPWTIDIRGVTSPVPARAPFYPRVDTGTLIPTRGLGVDVGGHVYLFNLGRSRVGIGLDVVNVRGRTTLPEPVAATPPPGSTPVAVGQTGEIALRMLAPQLSFNFGSRAGWSYLSAGLGTSDVTTQTAGGTSPRRGEVRGLRTLNFGGGARWFFNSHIGVGFDVRMHAIAAGTVEESGTPAPGAPPPAPVATPATRILAVAVGFSIK